MHVKARSVHALPMNQLTAVDIEYIRREYRSLETLCEGRREKPEEVRDHIAAGRLPSPTYVLPDGTGMFPEDYFVLLDEAGSIDELASTFERLYVAAAAAHGQGATREQVEAEWQGYLTGHYGVCLRRVTPENIYVKESLVVRLERHIAEPRPSDEGWRKELREMVAQLDALEREFAPYDRIRFGGPVSRDRLITAPRERYREAFAET